MDWLDAWLIAGVALGTVAGIVLRVWLQRRRANADLRHQDQRP